MDIYGLLSEGLISLINLILMDMLDRSPFIRGGRAMNKSHESSIPDSDISFVSSGRPSVDRMFPSLYEDLDNGIVPRLSCGSDFDSKSYGSSFSGAKSIDMAPPFDNFSFSSQSSGGISSLRLSDTTVRTCLTHKQTYILPCC